jgi:hypothetical protein
MMYDGDDDNDCYAVIVMAMMVAFMRLVAIGDVVVGGDSGDDDDVDEGDDDVDDDVYDDADYGD